MTLDYYDGPIIIVCKCVDCSSPKLLSVVSWKPDVSRIRIFGVTEVTLDWVTEVMERASSGERISAIGHVDPYDDDHEKRLSALLEKAPCAQAVFASSDVTSEIIAARDVKERTVTFAHPIHVISSGEFHQWLSYLGINSIVTLT